MLHALSPPLAARCALGTIPTATPHFLSVGLIYCCCILRSIARLAQVTTEQMKEAASTNPIDLSHEKELKLAKCIIKYPEVLTRILDDLYPHVLCDYLYELCTTFTEFYNSCYCMEKDRQTGKVLSVNISRLMLCKATTRVMEKALFILGISPVEKM